MGAPDVEEFAVGGFGFAFVLFAEGFPELDEVSGEANGSVAVSLPPGWTGFSAVDEGAPVATGGNVFVVLGAEAFNGKAGLAVIEGGLLFAAALNGDGFFDGAECF